MRATADRLRAVASEILKNLEACAFEVDCDDKGAWQILATVRRLPLTCGNR